MNNGILIPYDGSKYSDKAARTAIDQIRSLSRRPEKIMLLHVVSKIHLPPSLDYGMHMPNVKTTKQYRKELYQQMKGQALHMLEAKKQEFIRAGVDGVEARAVIGDPAEQILETASTEKIDLVVLGSIGLTGLAKLKILGSISRSVSERARCPVLVVH